MKNINKWLAVAGMAAAMAVTTAQATLITSGTSTLVSGNTAGNNITVSYSVNLAGAIYTYAYILNNPSTDTTSPDSFNVSFNTTPVGAVLGGNYTTLSPGGVSWVFTPVAPGLSSATFSFTSAYSYILGNANASDNIPPSPWSTIGQGATQLPVPHIPDGGATVMLLGAALSAMGLLRKKLIA
jgi:hypothetical protein